MTPFGLYLEHLRRSRGLQQQQLADQLHVAPCYISAIEKGRKGPPTSKIVDALIDALALNDQESRKLKMAAECSQRQRRIPGQTGIHEYSLIHLLWQRLGTLSEAETQALSSVLEINKRSDEGIEIENI